MAQHPSPLQDRIVVLLQHAPDTRWRAVDIQTALGAGTYAITSIRAALSRLVAKRRLIQHPDKRWQLAMGAPRERLD